ncbi:MAG: hypothetical protein CSA66_05160 [Proteobacteria bacterium]|nr:MAG: hypothetical protein CSA66_05160 [Pseudomonadota bacterium]
MDQAPQGPSRPQQLHFLRIRNPGKPLTLVWDPPAGVPAGFVVFATDNRFPPQMAAPLFAGQMRQFVDEIELERDALEFTTARAEAFYAVIWFDIDDNYQPVDNLREPDAATSPPVDIKSFAFTQVRSYLRIKYRPPVVPMRDLHVDLFVRDIEPTELALARMAEGSMNPDFVLPPRGDGFIDTLTAREWRKHYVAVAVGKDGTRRPLDLEAGGFLRLEEPQHLERGGKRKCDKLMEAVRDQLELELQRRSVSAEDFAKMVKRADDLSPFNPMIERIKRKARERFG